MSQITRSIVEKAVQLIKLKQYSDAVIFLEQAAQMGDDEAMFQLGILYTSGKGVKRNLETSLDYLKKSAAAGNAKAKAALVEHAKLQMLAGAAKPIEKKPEVKLETVVEDPKAAILYKTAKDLFAMDQSEKAILILEEAAGLGSGDAMYELGYRSTTGKGMPKDIQKGQQWIAKSAAAGNAKALDLQAQMKMMNLNLEAVKPLSADEYFRKGKYQEALNAYLKKDDEHALCQAALMYEKGYGTDTDIEKAIALLNKAVNLGSRYASRVLADWYNYGIHVEKDIEKAHRYYEKGALLEDSYCEYMLKEKTVC